MTEREWLESHGIRPRKRLGQNFLLDVGIAEAIERKAGWRPGAAVIEIGAGGGALTIALLAAGHTVTAVELDPGLAALLAERFAEETGEGRLVIRQGDILELPLADLAPVASAARAAEADRRPWLAGNLPYGVTTAILLRALAVCDRFGGAVFMVQREYGDRLLARAGEDAYGSLSVWTAAHATSRLLLRVGRSSFWPRPGVESAVIELVFPETRPFPGDRRGLERILRAAFGQRRKTLQNALSHGLGRPKDEVHDGLLSLGIDPGARAETLSLERFAAIVGGMGPRPD